MENFHEKTHGFQKFKLLLCQADKFTNPLNEQLDNIVKDKETYEKFFTWLQRLHTEHQYLVNKRVLIELLVRCCYVEKASKVSSLVIHNIKSLLPESDSFLTFFSLLFSSTPDHKRGKVITCMNRRTKRAIAEWYSAKGGLGLAQELLEVRVRGGWSHRDVIHMAHLSFADEDMKLVVDYIFKGWKGVKERSTSDSQRGVWDLFEGWESLKEVASGDEVAEVLKKHPCYRAHPVFIKSSKAYIPVRLAMLQTVALEGLLGELVVALEWMEGDSVEEEMLPHLEHIFFSRLDSLSVDSTFKSVRPLQVLQCLQTNAMGYYGVRKSLETLLYKLPASFDLSSKKVFIIIPPQEALQSKRPSFITLASFYICMLVRMGCACSVHPCSIQEVVAEAVRVEEVFAKLQEIPFNSSEESSYMEWLEGSGVEVDVVVVLTEHCSPSHFSTLSDSFGKYRQEKNPSLMLAVINLGVHDPSIGTDHLNIIFNGDNPRCLDIFNRLCHGYFHMD